MDESPAGKKPGIPLPVILASSFVLVFCALFSAFVFERIPHVNDEIAYLFQGRLFQSGRLYAPSPCGREFFDFPQIINNGKWYSIYPPGYPLLLVPGLALHAPWLTNPILAALAVLLIFLLGKEIYGRSVGLLAALLAAVSPWFLLMSSTLMSHTASLFFNTLFLLLFFRFLHRPSLSLGLAAGASWGSAFLIRPISALFFSLVFLLLFAVRFLRNQGKRGRQNALAFLIPPLLFFGLLLLYNTLTNGTPFRMGYLVRYGPSYSVIFGRAATLESDFTPLAGAVQMAENLRALNSDLFGWPVSSFLAMLPLLWLTRLKPEDRKRDLLLLSGIVCLIVAFSFFWGAFVFIGARMLFDALPLFLLLSARGMAEIPGLVGRISRGLSGATVKKMTAVFFSALTVYAFVHYLPQRIRPSHAHWYFDRFDHRFAGTSGRLGRAIDELKLGRAIVILKYWNRPPSTFPEEGGWGSGFLHDGPDLDTDIIYVRARNKSYDELFSCYPDRKVFLYLGTIDKGVLIPLKRSGSGIELGQPVQRSGRTEASVSIVGHPVEVFSAYSAEFGRFLRQLFRETSLPDMDGSLLEEMGMNSQTRGDLMRAAFCYEAALQVENDPGVRRNLLNRLLPCYQRTGQSAAAQRILAFIEKVNFDERRLYDVLPERGF
jgi:4-amino-4-deoxy-L-arabinose transferase-like glycosyltransferase